MVNLPFSLTIYNPPERFSILTVYVLMPEDTEKLLVNTTLPNKIIFDTYGDHRIAMAASIFIGSYEEITINDPDIVSKSYQGYWDDLKNAGVIL